MDPSNLNLALGGNIYVPHDWFPASQVRPFIFDDPALVWLEIHGAKHGLKPDEQPYSFLEFMAEKSRQFEAHWLKEFAPNALRVCQDASQSSRAEKERQTWELMAAQAPVIEQPALWWAPERIYGVPDAIVLASWLNEKFPELGVATAVDHYIAIDFKFTTRLDDRDKAKDLENYAAQVRIYSYMLGHLQGCMPGGAFLVSRDRVFNPLKVELVSRLGEPLDADLAVLRERYLEIKLEGEGWLPWRDPQVASNLSHDDERWRTAKQYIARAKVPGGDPALVYQVGQRARLELAQLGFPSLDSLLGCDPGEIPLEKSKGLGPKKSAQIRAVLQANRTKRALQPPPELVPVRKPFEFFVDFEYFVNSNVNFETQWPGLEGCEMIFLVGVGWMEAESWQFEAFAAEAESQPAEAKLFADCLAFLESQAQGRLFDSKATALYHWTSAEVWQSKRAAERHGWGDDHPLRRLLWLDLQRVFLDGLVGLPGAFGYDLKQVARALGEYAPAYATHWPDELGEGLNAMVMGWQAYQKPEPLQSEQMHTIRRYLEADCKALANILGWLRAA